jgi:hypothetical protein
MVKTANLRDRDDRAGFWWLDTAGFRAVLLQCQVWEDDDVIQTLPANGADDAST